MDTATSHSHPTITTDIVAVTVYTDQALITRRGKVTLTGQEQELILEHLPLTLQPASVRATGKGTVNVQLLGVRTEHMYATEPVAERVAELTQQIEHLKEQQLNLRDRVDSLHLQRSFVQSLSEKSVERFSRSLAQQQATLAQTGELLGFLGQRYEELSGAIAQGAKEVAQVEKQLVALRQQLQQIKTPRPKESYSLLVAIAPSGAGEFELEVSYTSDRASWVPLYDLRVNTKDNQIYLTYLAEIQQTTGEDWLGVALTLSTAKPGLGTLPPKLAPWYIDIPRPPVPMPAAVPQMMRSRATTAAPKASPSDSEDVFADLEELLDSGDDMRREPSFAAQTVTAQVNSEGGVVTFQIGGNSDVPGDGGSHKTTIFESNYPCRLEYIAIPKQVSFAYLQAVVTNPASGATLLPGQANIFRDNMFVGTTPLENVAPGQEFKLNLGIDEGLKLERELVERKVDKRFMNDKRLITYGYRLLITNLRNQAATLKLTEQLPVSRNEQIKVKLTRSAPPIQPGEMGLLEWSLPLPPQAKQEVTYQFTVEHPRELTVIGLS